MSTKLLTFFILGEMMYYHLWNTSPVDQMVANNFHVLEHNVENVEDAKIIFLGEHYTLSHKVKINWLLKKVYQLGDIVLVEH